MALANFEGIDNLESMMVPTDYSSLETGMKNAASHLKIEPAEISKLQSIQNPLLVRVGFCGILEQLNPNPSSFYISYRIFPGQLKNFPQGLRIMPGYGSSNEKSVLLINPPWDTRQLSDFVSDSLGRIGLRQLVISYMFSALTPTLESTLKSDMGVPKEANFVYYRPPGPEASCWKPNSMWPALKPGEVYHLSLRTPVPPTA
jgi:hypothetical protein